MWIGGAWIPISRELLYGVGCLLFLMIVIMIVVVVKRRRSQRPFSTNRVFRGKNLERAGNGRRDLSANYDDLPIVGLKWENGDSPPPSGYYEEESDEDEDVIDDGYTVVEKTIQEKAKQLQFTPQQKVSPSSSSSSPKKETKKESKKESKTTKKDATDDKMDFFTTGKSAL